MDNWFFHEKEPKGWNGYPNRIDRRCYPNSCGRGVHIWGSKTGVGGEASIVAGFATFDRLEICEMLEFLKVLYNPQTSEWVLLKARGSFFHPGPDAKDILSDTSHTVVEDGHYTWPLTSRTVTAPGSANQSANGTATPNRASWFTEQFLRHLITMQSEKTRRDRRTRDGRCRVTGKLAVERGEPRGRDWTALQCAHVLPLAWSAQSYMEKMFSTEALALLGDLGGKDLIDNTILMDARVHMWFDDYRFGIWPVLEDGRWYGKIFRFEHSSCNVGRQWLLAAARPSKFPLPAHGQSETKLQREMREKDDQERGEDPTRCDLTNEPILREVLRVHFETCLHWHVKGMGWNK
ncbi:hypothetical protein B0H14DRAFT_2875661 [Mycena olivaceomarginata]|nr:hypothetical protein B0H14DRAFT_2875661 [Mycena olivaceomarginata]